MLSPLHGENVACTAESHGQHDLDSDPGFCVFQCLASEQLTHPSECLRSPIKRGGETRLAHRAS